VNESQLEEETSLSQAQERAIGTEDGGPSQTQERAIGTEDGGPSQAQERATGAEDGGPSQALERAIGTEDGGTRAVSPGPLALEPSMTVEAVLQGVARECLANFSRYEGAALAGEFEAFHQMRVALRRLRSMVSALRSMLPPEERQWLQEELKWLANSLGPTRDWDVFASALLAPIQTALPEDSDLKQLAEAVTQRREAAYAHAKEALRSHRYAESVQKLSRWFEARSWRDRPASEHSALLYASIADVAPRLIERRWRKTRKRSKRFAKLTQIERHQLRIALKQLRYIIEFVGALFHGHEVKAMMKRLKPLQEKLGHLNDVRTAVRLIKEIAPPPNSSANQIGKYAGLVLGWHLRGVADEEAKLAKQVRRLRKTRAFWSPVQHDSSATIKP